MHGMVIRHCALPWSGLRVVAMLCAHIAFFTAALWLAGLPPLEAFPTDAIRTAFVVLINTLLLEDSRAIRLDPSVFARIRVFG